MVGGLSLEPSQPICFCSLRRLQRSRFWLETGLPAWYGSTVPASSGTRAGSFFQKVCGHRPPPALVLPGVRPGQWQVRPDLV